MKEINEVKIRQTLDKINKSKDCLYLKRPIQLIKL